MNQDELLQQRRQRQADVLARLGRVRPTGLDTQDLEHVAAGAHNAALKAAEEGGLALAPAFQTSYDFLQEGNKSYYRALVNALAIFLLRNPAAAAEQQARARRKEVDSVEISEMLPDELHRAALLWYAQNRITLPPAVNVLYALLDEHMKDYYRAMAEAMLGEIERRGETTSVWGSPWS